MDALPPLAALPLEALDAEFEARLRAAPRAVQDRLLAEADLQRVADDDTASWRALTVYRALVARLEEPGPVHLERAAWTAQASPARDEVQRRIATRALEHPGDAEHAAAVCTLAACEWQTGEFVASERRLRELLAHVRGRGDAVELDVAYTLACLYAWQRRELEALLLARLAVGVAERRPDLEPVHAAHALSALADAYRSLEDEAGLAQTAQRLLALSTRLADPDGRRVRRQAYVIAHEAALLRGEIAAAREQLDAAQREHALDTPQAGHQPRVLDYHVARLALRERRPEVAAPLVAHHVEAQRAHPVLGLLWGGLALELDVATGAFEAARARGAELLARLADPVQRAQLGTGRRITQAQRVGELLAAVPGADVPAGQAWREATDAAYDRLGELARAQHDLPELARPTPEDHETLARYRSRFLGRHRLLIEHLRELLAAERARGRLPDWAHASPGGFTAVCAWCRSVRDPEGRWLPLGHFVATSGPHLTVTHGICETCRRSAFA